MIWIHGRKPIYINTFLPQWSALFYLIYIYFSNVKIENPFVNVAFSTLEENARKGIKNVLTVWYEIPTTIKLRYEFLSNIAFSISFFPPD